VKADLLVRKTDKQTTVPPENDLNDLVPTFVAFHGQDDTLRTERGSETTEMAAYSASTRRHVIPKPQ
jgi:hypothetical protein